MMSDLSPHIQSELDELSDRVVKHYSLSTQPELQAEFVPSDFGTKVKCVLHLKLSQYFSIRFEEKAKKSHLALTLAIQKAKEVLNLKEEEIRFRIAV